MIGIVAPAAARGHVAELVALALVIAIARRSGNDLVATRAGVATVARLRAAD